MGDENDQWALCVSERTGASSLRSFLIIITSPPAERNLKAHGDAGEVGNNNASLRHLAGATHHHHRVAANSSSVQLRRPSSCLAGARPLRSRFTGVYALSSNDIRVGTNVVTSRWTARRGGFLIPEASISKETKQFTYKDGSQFVFMDLMTFEESRLNEAEVGEKHKWLKEGMDCNLLYWNGRIIDFELPITVRLTVTDTDPGQGDSAQGGTKPATLETVAVVTVPSFVNVGDDILVDSRTGQYMNRA